MQLYHFALFFACVGAVMGMVDYIMIDSGGDNWFDQGVPDTMNVINVGEDDIDSMQSMANETGSTSLIDNIGTMMGIFWNMIKGVLNITGMLDDFLVWDVEGRNLFSPVLLLFQSMIYIIYIIGSIQFITNRSTKSMD